MTYFCVQFKNLDGCGRVIALLRFMSGVHSATVTEDIFKEEKKTKKQACPSGPCRYVSRMIEDVLGQTWCGLLPPRLNFISCTT